MAQKHTLNQMVFLFSFINFITTELLKIHQTKGVCVVSEWCKKTLCCFSALHFACYPRKKYDFSVI